MTKSSTGIAKKNNVSLALGTFDGIHSAHIKVLNEALKNADYPIVITFNNTPKNILNKKEEEKLTVLGEKEKMLKKMGFKQIVSLNFDEVKNIEPLDFLNLLTEKYNPKKICCGFNYRFGKNAKGDITFLKDFCNRKNIEFCYINKVVINNKTVSSSYIRELINSGNVKEAKKFLGRYFSFEEKIVHGDKRGRTIGFPTINQIYPAELVKPKFGVYKSNTYILGKKYKSVTNLGIRPTFKSDKILAETYIFDFKNSVYGRKAKVELTDFIRSEKKFNNLEELKEAILKDKNSAKE